MPVPWLNLWVPLPAASSTAHPGRGSPHESKNKTREPAQGHSALTSAVPSAARPSAMCASTVLPAPAYPSPPTATRRSRACPATSPPPLVPHRGRTDLHTPAARRAAFRPRRPRPPPSLAAPPAPLCPHVLPGRTASSQRRPEQRGPA